MKLTYITAFRYTFSNAKNQKRSTFIIILGVCISLVAVLLLSSVMNGLQASQLDRLRNLDSFDVVIENSKLSVDEILEIDGVDYAYEFIDANVLISNIKTGKSSTARIRGIDLQKYINKRTENDFSYRSYNKDSSNTLTLSTSMQNRFYAKIGDDLQVTFLRKGKTTVAPYNRTYELGGLYVCSMSDFSSNNAFIGIDELKSIYGSDSVKLGVFCTSDFEEVVNSISKMDPNAKVTGWKEANRALYSALMLEKSMMYLFLGFVFVIISVNLKNSTKRLLENKVGESAVLRTYGMSSINIYWIFILQGVFATGIGSVLGLIIGYILVRNLANVLLFADKVLSFFSGQMSYLSSIPMSASFNWKEAIFIVLYIFILTVVFAFLGCRKIHKMQIMEILSNATFKI